jgi:hypothetical protein
MTRFFDEMTNHSVLPPPLSGNSLRPIGVSFYGEDQSQHLVDDDMTRWGSMLPPLYVPRYLEVDLFVVKMQQTYDCIGTSSPVRPWHSPSLDDADAFKMPVFIKEIEGLRLKNQQLTVSTHLIDGANEPMLALSLEGCRRFLVQRKREAPGESEEIAYLSGECIWGHLQHQQEALVGSGSDKKNKLLLNKHHVVCPLPPSCSFSSPPAAVPRPSSSSQWMRRSRSS